MMISPLVRESPSDARRQSIPRRSQCRQTLAVESVKTPLFLRQLRNHCVIQVYVNRTLCSHSTEAWLKLIKPKLPSLRSGELSPSEPYMAGSAFDPIAAFDRCPSNEWLDRLSNQIKARGLRRSNPLYT